MRPHKEFGPKLKQARELRSKGVPSNRIAARLDVSESWVRKHTKDVEGKAPPHRPRIMDYDKAIRLLQRPMSARRIAMRLGVNRNAIYSMIERMLESTVEEGGQI